MRRPNVCASRGAMIERWRRILFAWFAVLAALAWMLIVVGALVRAHGAGLACPDWPLCFGQLVPTFDLKVALPGD